MTHTPGYVPGLYWARLVPQGVPDREWEVWRSDGELWWKEFDGHTNWSPGQITLEVHSRIEPPKTDRDWPVKFRMNEPVYRPSKTEPPMFTMRKRKGDRSEEQRKADDLATMRELWGDNPIQNMPMGEDIEEAMELIRAEDERLAKMEKAAERRIKSPGYAKRLAAKRERDHATLKARTMDKGEFIERQMQGEIPSHFNYDDLIEGAPFTERVTPTANTFDLDSMGEDSFDHDDHIADGDSYAISRETKEAIGRSMFSTALKRFSRRVTDRDTLYSQLSNNPTGYGAGDA